MGDVKNCSERKVIIDSNVSKRSNSNSKSDKETVKTHKSDDRHKKSKKSNKSSHLYIELPESMYIYNANIIN